MSDLVSVAPFATLALAGLAIGVAARRVRADERSWLALAMLASITSFAVAALAGSGPDALGGLVRRDSASAFTATLVGLAAAATWLLALGDQADTPPRAIARLLIAAAGAVLASIAGDVVVMAIGIGLAGGGTSAVLVALGGILVFADVGSTRVGAIGGVTTLSGLAGVALILSGLAIAATLAPFHRWARELSRTGALTHFSGLVARIAAFAALLRIAGAISATGTLSPDWRASIAVLASLTIVVATVAALSERSLSRVFGYLAIAQAGCAAAALAAGVAAGPAIAFALVTSAALALGGAAVAAAIGDNAPGVADLRGLARRDPLLVASLALVLLGCAGSPPTAGFIARVYVFEIAMGAQLAWLVILGSLASVVATVVALRVVFASLGEGERRPAGRRAGRAAVVLAAAVVLLIGIFPGPLLDAVGNVSF
jgi:NADH-quinone oxidoreductase subunit N